MDHFGLWAIVPPLVAIIAAVVTRQVYLSLTLGILSAAAIFAEGNLLRIPLVFVEFLMAALVDDGHIAVIAFTLFLGALIALLQRSGGMRGFAQWALKWAKTPRRATFVGWLLGLFIFIDDYFDTIAVGTVMRPVTDRNAVSREKLAYIVDTTAAPMAVIAPISTWVGVIVATIAGVTAMAQVPYSAFQAFLRSIPFNFYAILAMAWALYIVLSRVEYGPMRTAEHRARTTGQLLRPGATPLQSAELDQFGFESDAPPRLYNLVLPIVTLVAVAVSAMWGTGYVFLKGEGVAAPGLLESFQNADPFLSLVIASIVAVVYAGAYFGFQRIVSMKEFFEAIEVGFKAMLPAVMVLTLAWTIGYAIEVLGLGATMARVVEQSGLGPGMFPAILFALAGVTAFATGTSFGTFIIMLPISINIAVAFDVGLVPAYIAATVGGAVFGDHASPISDTTVLSSMASASDHVDHVRTQLPYAGTVAVMAFTGYLTYGFLFESVGEVAAGIVSWAVLGALFVLAAFGAKFVFGRLDTEVDEGIEPHAPGAEAAVVGGEA